MLKLRKVKVDEAKHYPLVISHSLAHRSITMGFRDLKCHLLFGPQFSKVKRRFVFEIRQVSDTLTPNVGVSDDTPV